MTDSPAEMSSLEATDRLLAYVADFELEVDDLRLLGAFIVRKATEIVLKSSN